jgi:hypothetical protein
MSRPANPGALQRAAVKDGPQGHRSSRREASLRVARCHAKLWNGEDISDGLTDDRCRRLAASADATEAIEPGSSSNNSTRRWQLYETNHAGSG